MQRCVAEVLRYWISTRQSYGMAELSDDPRWIRFIHTDSYCSKCEKAHRGVFDLSTTCPVRWNDSDIAQPNTSVVGANHILTEDFCIIDGRDFFVRGMLYLPIVGAPNLHLGLGCWSSLAEDNFYAYLESFNNDDQAGLGPWLGWLSNSLKGSAETLGLRCLVRPVDGGQRPHIELDPAEFHQLAQWQREGIDFDSLLEFYAENGHDVRTGLKT